MSWNVWLHHSQHHDTTAPSRALAIANRLSHDVAAVTLPLFISYGSHV
jgi:hypothetical protein